jgi:hypothetical protein
MNTMDCILFQTIGGEGRKARRRVILDKRRPVPRQGMFLRTYFAGRDENFQARSVSAEIQYYSEDMTLKIG